MALSTTFKQQCPSCEAMISIKEGMVGKKVECTKCKDKFIAKKPVEEDVDEEAEESAGKKNTKTAGKKNTAVSTKTPPPSKRSKMEVDEDDEDEDESPRGKNGKAKANTNGKAKSSSKHADDDEDEEDDDDAAAKKKKKLTIGLALAGLGVVILVIAAIFVLRGSRPATNNPSIKPQGGPDMAGGDKDKKGGPITFVDGKGPGETTAVALSEGERAKLSNLLPNDTEHVFRINLKELFDPAGNLRGPVFETPGTLDDETLKRQLGFSLLAIDDMLCAERVTSPWKFTVIHFKDLINEKELVASLKLKAVGKGIEGQAYYKMDEPNPWFNHLSRFTFGVPSNLRALEPQVERATYLRIHNGQTLIVADESPMLAFLKVKGQFAMLSTPSSGGPANPPMGNNGGNPMPMPGNMTGVTPMPMPNMMGGNPMPNPAMMGGNPMPNPAMMGGNPMPMPMPPRPMPNMMGATPMPMPPRPMGASVSDPMSQYEFTLLAAQQPMPQPPMPMPPMPMPGMMGGNPMPNPMMMGGNPMPNPMMMGGNPMPNMMGGTPMPPNPMPPSPNPNPVASAPESYMTIKPDLKAALDRMEGRGVESKDKVLLSSATNMDATVLETRSLDFKNTVPRKARQFWDVTLLLHETKPRIRTLGTALVQRDTLKYRLRNEITCGVEGDAKDFTDQLNDRVAKSVARFIQQLVNHEVKINVAAAGPVTPAPPQVPNPNPNPNPLPPEAKDDKKTDPVGSQITIAQQFTTVDFTLDLILEGSTLTQARNIASLNASIMRVEMESALASMRHQLAAAGKSVGEKGLSQKQLRIPPGTLPPGAFERLRDPDSTKPPPLRVDREPKNRISFMAGLLPYMGHQNLFDKVKFEQSWRDPGNWMAGRTVVPQFLDPTYPDRTRQVTFNDLPVDFAATHYVGIAGVGLDAASYKRNDPATAHLRGPFSYDESASLPDFKRGTANTILMIQIPHDGVTGVSPWIAGGGATLRGIPEKNSIAPFVAINDGKKKGTYAMMADGSVRFIDKSISDEVFKAMGTLEGPTPADFADQLKKVTEDIPSPEEKAKKDKDLKEKKAKPPEKALDPKDGKDPKDDKTPAKDPTEDKTPSSKDLKDEKTPGKSPEDKNSAATQDKASLQGTWSVVSMEADGKAAPPEIVQSMRFQFKGDSLVVHTEAGEENQAYRLDPSKSPKVIELIPPKERAVKGTYELTKDQLRLVLNPEKTAKTAPNTPPPPPMTSVVIVVLRRQ